MQKENQKNKKQYTTTYGLIKQGKYPVLIFIYLRLILSVQQKVGVANMVGS